MVSRRAQAYAGLAIGSLGLGTIVWVLRREAGSAAPIGAVGGSDVPATPAIAAGSAAPSPAEADPGALDRAIVLLLDRTVPGTAGSYDLLKRWLESDAPAVAATERIYQQRFATWLVQQVEEGRVSELRAEQAGKILRDFSLASSVVGQVADVVGKVVSQVAAVPGVGAVIKGVWDIVKLFGEGAVEAAKQGKNLFSPGLITSGGVPIFTGWKDSCYYCWDVPVWSFTSPMWLQLFRAAGASAAFEPVWQSFIALSTGLPFGPRVPRVEIQNDGSYFYKFNVRGIADYSLAAESRGEIRGLQVWNIADITPTGPRGFDPAHPLAWKRPGLKTSVFDAVLPPGAPPP